MAPNHIKNIAIVGAGGRSGKSITEALLKSGKHNTTAITRPDSTNEIPAGTHNITKVDYNNHKDLVQAMKGQDVLIVTMNVFAPPESQKQLVDAAIEAGVQWILPNEWGIDLSKEDVGKDTLLGERLLNMRRYIEDTGHGRLKWIGVACSFWYEFSLAGSEARYGFDFDKKELTLFDDGNTKINTTTWEQVACAVASLLSLKVHPDGLGDKEANLTQFANSSIYVSSFFVSQRDMLASVLQVTGDQEADWRISYESSHERFERASRLFKDQGVSAGLVMMLYTRVFYPDGSGDFEHKLHNSVLGLPVEDLNSATRRAVQMALAGETNMPGDRKRTM